MKNVRTNKLLESVKGGSNLGFIREIEGNEFLIYLSYGIIMGARVRSLVIDDVSTDDPEDEKIPLGKVTEEEAKSKAQEILKERGIDVDMTQYQFNFDGTL